MKKIKLDDKQIKELKKMLQKYELSSPNEYTKLLNKLNSAQDGAQRKQIENALHAPYENFQKNEKDVNRFMEILNVDYCPYCNINDVIAVIDGNGKRLCRPDFDHFDPQSTHP